ncbi:VOC family protein [Sphingomonas bacterium]|uniref:VOC family protein n=1 Tax=Sphingomonas bacterium TaxID=1895847 RepID=UPI0015760EF3|nr:VOC family protein [Sphingomonas bacterium]
MADPRIDFIELPSGETPAMQAFYGSAFGWAFTAFGPSYACTMTGDVDIGFQADAEERTTAILPAIRVDDLEAALADVERAGGTISRPIFAFPGGRRFHFTDPAGNELAAYQGD